MGCEKCNIDNYKLEERKRYYSKEKQKKIED